MKTKRICWFSLFLFVFLFQIVSVYAVVLDGFDYPIGIPDHSGWYNAQDFLVNDHLGEDWNIKKSCPEDSTGITCDIGKPVYAIANGKVIRSGYYSGWGNVIMIKHDLPPWNKENYEYVVSLYAHLGNSRQVSENEYARRGQVIGYIGSRSENGGYSPHLHLELRTDKFKERFNDDAYRGCGYLNDAHCNITDPTGWLDSSDFIDAHRPSILPLAGDWNNDGIDTTGTFTPGTTCGEECQAQGGSAKPPEFSLDNGAPIKFGEAGDYPIIGDWDNDGYDEIGLWRLFKDHIKFYLDSDNNGGIRDKEITFDYPHNIPITGDWNNDGNDDIGGYDAPTSTFYLYKLSYYIETIFPYNSILFGDSTKRDYPIIGDWDGDNQDDLGVFRAKFPNNETNTFFLAKGQTGETDISYEFRNAGDIPIIGDWDGDGDDNIGFYDPATGEFYLESNIPSFNNPDATAVSDIIERAESDSRFKSAIVESFGKNLNWDTNWELRWMDFNFIWWRTVRIWHATNKTDSSIRYTIFWDPDVWSWTSWERAYSLDKQAKQDMIKESKNDFRFGNYIPGTFGKNLETWSLEWELRWMDFSFYGNRIVKIWHATKKSDSSIRYTIFWDPDVHNWTDWIKVK